MCGHFVCPLFAWDDGTWKNNGFRFVWISRWTRPYCMGMVTKEIKIGKKKKLGTRTAARENKAAEHSISLN